MNIVCIVKINEPIKVECHESATKEIVYRLAMEKLKQMGWVIPEHTALSIEEVWMAGEEP